MRRVISTVGEEQEGLCYELDRAQQEGLHEELKLTMIPIQYDAEPIRLQLSDADFDYFQRRFDLGVNIGPGVLQGFILVCTYEYNYGEEVTAHG